MSPEALWSIEFVDNEEHHGGGIAVLQNKRILGGNTSFTYVGDYHLEGGDIICNAHIRRFNDVMPGIYKDDFHLSVRGRFDDLQFIATGAPLDDDSLLIAVQFTRQGEIV